MSEPTTDTTTANLWRRLMGRVRVTPGCWLWMGNTNAGGYGSLGVTEAGRTRTVYAHRLAYELFVGPIPAGLFVCHRCDVKRCVNPAHLYAGTPKDNTRDMIARGRKADPWKNRTTVRKLTADQVAEIRRRTREDGAKRVELAAEFGVAAAHIRGIINGRVWRHLGDSAPSLSA